MEVMKILVLVCIVCLAACRKESSTTPDVTEETETIPSEEVSSPTSMMTEIITKASIDTNGDIILTTPVSEVKDTTTSSGTSEVTTPASTTETEETTPSATTLGIESTTPEGNWSVCSTNPCKNGGKCSEDPSEPMLFHCHCKRGYAGLRCGTEDGCTSSENGYLCNNGACVYTSDAESRSCKCFRRTYWDDIRKKCKAASPPCFPNPCQNGGICLEKKSKFLCQCAEGYEGEDCSIRNKCGTGDVCDNGVCTTDLNGNLKYCQCNDTYYWNEDTQSCEVVVPPCIPNPCKNSGHCEPLATGDFNCSCTMQYSGPTCEFRDFCVEDIDCINGVCQLSDTDKSRRCQCDKGFYLDEESHTCKEILKPCFPNPCSNDGICIPSSDGAYKCKCSEGFTGTRCTDKDLCVLNGGHAFCGKATCNSDLHLGVYYCTCSEGHYFDYTERQCKVADLCPLMNCDSSAICIKSTCKCKENFKWNNETEKCQPDFCSSNPCPVDDMVCEEGDGNQGYKCSCKQGYAFDGTRCKKATCVFPKLNSCNQICGSADDGYMCGCYDDQFQMKEDNVTCVYTGNMTCTNKTCENGFCLKQDEEETCVCSPGYMEIEGKCIDLCIAGQIPKGMCPNDQCESDSEVGFRCKCEGKFAFSSDKVTCTVRRLCQRGESGWNTCNSQNATCEEDWSTIDGYRCLCSKGQMKTDQGICQDICSFEKNQRHCSSLGAMCDVDDKGKKICTCPPYFQAEDEETVCNKQAEFSYIVTLPVDMDTYQGQRTESGRNWRTAAMPEADYRKIRNDVTLAIGSLFIEFLSANVLKCTSLMDYYLCKVELQFEAISTTELKRLMEEKHCIRDKSVSNDCLLPPSLVLRRDKITSDVTIRLTDPCDPDIKENLCGSETRCYNSADTKTFNCSCKPGFTGRRKMYPFEKSDSFIEICKDINECELGSPCSENAECTNTIGSYSCSCLPGYRINNDSSDIKNKRCVKICDPSPCVHGECIVSGDHTFDCRCDAGFAGARCDMKDENFKHARINTAIVGAVLGGVLLLTIILSVACISRLKKKKFLDDPNNILYNSAEMTERRPPVMNSGAINNAYQSE